MENYSMLRLCKDNGKEHGNNYSILGLHKDNGRENGNYYSQCACSLSQVKGTPFGTA